MRQLEYKCKWYGRTLVKIDRWFPSTKRCGNCGYIVESLPLNIREWDCSKCGTHHDRDINAARNLHAAGLAVLSEAVLTGEVSPVKHARDTGEVCEANIRPDNHKVKRQLRKTLRRCSGRRQ